MAKIRVYELAKELGVESKIVIARLQQMGEFVRSASSTVEAPIASRLRSNVADPAPSRSFLPTQPNEPERVDARPGRGNASGKHGHLHGLCGEKDVDIVIRECKSALRGNAKSLILDMSDAKGLYPNAAVPVA